MNQSCPAQSIIIFGTDTGNTEEVGEKIQSQLGSHGVQADMLNITEAGSANFANHDLVILGIPTWDFGGVQQDWEEFEAELLTADLSDTVVALYGLGDQFGYGDFFLDAMGWLHERIVKLGAHVIGHWPTEGYDFEASLALNEDKTLFCGLAIDEDQQFEQTDQRVQAWVEQIVSEYAHHNAA